MCNYVQGTVNGNEPQPKREEATWERIEREGCRPARPWETYGAAPEVSVESAWGFPGYEPRS